MTDALPSWDEAVGSQDNGPPSNNGPPSWDEAMAKAKPSFVGGIAQGIGTAAKAVGTNLNPFASSQDLASADDNFMQNTAVGRVLKDFGHGVSETTDDFQQLGLSDESTEALKKTGVFNDYAKGEFNVGKALVQGVVTPAAAGLDALMRAGAGVGIAGPAYAIGGAAEESGVPNARKAGQELSEYALNSPVLAELHPPEAKFTPENLKQAKSVGALDSEAVYMGTKEPTPDQAMAQRVAAEALPEEPAPKDINTVARSIAPETFDKYDRLTTTQETLRSQLSDLADQRTADLDAQIKEIQDAKQGGYGKLQSLIAKRDDIASQDTPEMAAIRQKLQDNDYAMRDLAPDVSAAYRKADESAPQEQTPAEGKPVEQTVPQEQTGKPIEAQRQSIIDDMTQKLTAVGRPKEEVGAAAQLEAARYETLATQYPKFNAEEWYKREAANIKAGRERVLTQKDELEQSQRGKIRLATDDTKATITLMKSANASTLIHEKGHEWTDQLLRLSAEDDAPQQMKDDAATIRKYGGAGEDGTIPTRGHEKLARGFERYLMEGTAPSRALAGVFAKFKQWLTAIYSTVEKLRSPISNDIRDVFDRLLSAKPEKTVLAPDHEPGKMLADIHEADAQHTPPEHAAAVRDNIEAEQDQLAKSHDKEIYNALKSASETGNITKTPDSAEPTSTAAPAPGQGSPVTEPPQVVAGGSDVGAKGSGERATNGASPSPTSGNAESAADKPSTEPSTDKPSTNPNARLGRSQSNLIDKAGNIRFDNLNTPEDVNTVLKQTANENDNFMQARRGVIPVGEQLNLADALGMNANTLNFRKIGEAFNAEQIIAARKLLIQSATTVRDLMNGTDVAAYAEAKARHLMIQEHVAGLTAEAGRALGAFRKLEGSEETQALGDFLKQATGKDLFQLQQEMDFGKNLQTPAQVAKFLDASKKASFRDMVLEYYINALISGPVTHLRYSVGNAINALATPLFEIPAQAAIGALRGDADRVYLGEAGAQLHGLLKGSQDGLKAAVTAFKTGQSPLLPGEEASANFAGEVKVNAIPGKTGQVLNVPSKSVSAIHSFFKSIRYEQNIQALAYRTAMKEGLKGDSFTNRVAELSTSPSEEMMNGATASALKSLYMEPTEYNSFMGQLNRTINSNLAAKIIVPFMKIGSQITKEAFIERTPLGLLDKGVRQNILAGGASMDTQLGKMAFGTALMGGMSLMVMDGNATGDGPNDPAQRSIWMLNHRPNSIQIGDITIPYQGLGHLGMLMRFSANMTESAKGWNEEDGGKLAVSFLEGMSKSVLDENFMRGIKDLLDAVYHPEEYGSRYVKGFATNWLPFSVGLGQTARMIDPDQREAQSIMDAARAKIPFESESLLPRRDRFGEPIPSGAALPKYQNDPVVQRMEALNMGIGTLGRKITNVPLSDEQYDDYSRIAGRMTKMRLNAVVASPSFASAPPAAQIETIHKSIEIARETARSVIKMKYPEIAKQATEAKLSALKGKQ